MTPHGGERPLEGRRILVGVSGGIAAYKAVLLVRQLMHDGATVDVAMTRGARQFIGATTFEGVTGRYVGADVWEDVPLGTHVQVGRDADVLVVYPMTAHTLAKIAHGFADDLLTTAALAHDGPLVVAPAMHTEMWSHPVTSRNIAMLRDRGVVVVGPATGELMGGETGVGRVVEPEEVRAALYAVFGVDGSDTRAAERPLAGKTLLVTAGGTREPIDPVRFLGNRSSGRMGFAIAHAAAQQGAVVVLIAAPSELETPPGARRVNVESARDMDAAVRQHEGVADAIVMAAAVADFRPKHRHDEKLARSEGPPELLLVPNPDILAGVISRRGEASHPVVVGFAAQTGNLERAAQDKLEKKHVDMIVANDVAQPGIGFESHENEVLILHADGRRRHVPRTGKELVAEIVLSELWLHLMPEVG